MLGRVLEACGIEKEAMDHLHKAWTLREELTGIKGTAMDEDSDYNALVFYWSH